MRQREGTLTEAFATDDHPITYACEVRDFDAQARLRDMSVQDSPKVRIGSLPSSMALVIGTRVLAARFSYGPVRGSRFTGREPRRSRGGLAARRGANSLFSAADAGIPSAGGGALG